MNGIIVVDKPAGWTSHDVVAKLRGILRERRIGHSGTLDPMATGVLVVFVGRATRAVSFAEADDKRYIASVRLGIETDTQDITGTVLSEKQADISRAEFETALKSFEGESMQLPPMYSAVKKGGKKLYELARRGLEIEREPRKISLSGLEVLSGEKNEFTFDVTCSKGAYIRTLCSDIGAKLGCGGAMSALRRIRAGAFGIDDAVTLEQAEACGDKAALLRGTDTLFRAFPEYFASAAAEKKCRCGADFECGELENGKYRVYSEDGEFLMLGEAERGNMKTVKSFFEI